MASRSHTPSPGPLSVADEPLEVEPDEVPTALRQVQLVERLELNMPTSRLNPNAIILGDIDNDPTQVRKPPFSAVKTSNCPLVRMFLTI